MNSLALADAVITLALFDRRAALKQVANVDSAMGTVQPMAVSQLTAPLEIPEYVDMRAVRPVVCTSPGDICQKKMGNISQVS